jgi:hypothetical protein
MAKSSARWPGPEYHVTATFRAPIRYVFRWCTDFRPGDERLEKEEYTRRVVSRSPKQVVFEDLSDAENGGWTWARHVVSLDAPNGWHSESVGSHRTSTLDYRLTSLPGDRTRLDLTWRRRPTSIGRKSLPKAKLERETTRAWKEFGRALEKDYRRSRKGRAH